MEATHSGQYDASLLSKVDALPVSTFSNDAGYSTTTGTVTPSSTDTFTNKSGNISQWTNDAGYLTSETDSQTLSFSTPDLTISNGNTVDLTTLKTTSLPFSSITSTPTTIAGYGITDAFSGAYADLTGKPTIPTNNNQLTNGKSGSNSQWTNDEAYITAGALTPYYTSTQVDALPVSTFSNDAGYLTTETDSQTLSFTSPNLSISNGNSVDLSGLIDGGTY